MLAHLFFRDRPAAITVGVNILFYIGFYDDFILILRLIEAQNKLICSSGKSPAEHGYLSRRIWAFRGNFARFATPSKKNS